MLEPSPALLRKREKANRSSSGISVTISAQVVAADHYTKKQNRIAAKSPCKGIQPCDTIANIKTLSRGKSWSASVIIRAY